MALRTYVHALMTDRRHGIAAGAAKFVLWLMSLAYGAAVRAAVFAYRRGLLPSWRAPRPVISVGNVTVGGSGKTPLVIAVVQALLLRQLRVAVLTRGYMPAPGAVSDEARMLQEALPGVPVLVGANRRRSIENFLRSHAVDVFVCDDAFQHWPLRRDLDIVAVDAVNPFGNGCLVPRGILREPWDALGRAHIVVLTKTDHGKASAEEVAARVASVNPRALIVAAQHRVVGCRDVYSGTEIDHMHFKGISAVTFCAIADPQSFQHSVQAAGMTVANPFVFMDHHVYTEEDMAMVRKYAQDHDVKVIVTTHKDAVKIGAFKQVWQGFKVYSLEVELEITHGKNVFIERIMSAARR